jgi:hypothetical protein
MKKIRIILVVSVAFLILGIGSLVVYDIHQDRQNNIVLDEEVPAYADWAPYPAKTQKPLFMLPKQTSIKVERIRYGKDYMAVYVEAQSGKRGWIFTGYSFIKAHN